jgi:hypothetical protein
MLRKRLWMNPFRRAGLFQLVALGRGVVVLGALLVACGGRTSGASGGGDDGGSTDTSHASPPQTGSSCTNGVTCEYGTDAGLQCNTLATCTDGAWFVQAAQTGAPCPTAPPGANGCPATFADVPVGQACAVSAGCAYADGLCACTSAALGGPVESSRVWVCAQSATGCPEPRPRAGAACSEENQNCDYGACTVPGAPEMECTNGRWVAESVACASGVVPLGSGAR